jgi:hypothetical protein
VETRDVDLSFTSRRDDSDVKGYLCFMGIVYSRYFITFYILIFNIHLKLTNIVWNIKNIGKSTTEVTDEDWSGTLELSFGWVPIYTAIRKSLIILDHSWKGATENKMSTCRSWHTVSDLHSCERIFNICLPTPKTIPSNSRIYTLI